MMKIYGHEMNADDFESIVLYMDEDILEEVHREMAPCSNETFLRAYIQKDERFIDLLEKEFSFEDDGEDEIDHRDFMVGLYQEANDPAQMMSPDAAAEDLEHLRREGFDVPSDITSEEYADLWNAEVFRACEDVYLPSGLRVPRWCAMEDREIAAVIDEAGDWSEVEDLVEYVLRDIGGDRDDVDVEAVVEDWCEANR